MASLPCAQLAFLRAVCLWPAVPAEGAVLLEVVLGSLVTAVGDRSKMFALAVCLAQHTFADSARALDENSMLSVLGCFQ